MDLHFDDALCEAAVEAVLRGEGTWERPSETPDAEAKGETRLPRSSPDLSNLTQAFRAEANRIYRTYPPHRRLPAFVHLYQKSFRELGLPANISSLLGELGPKGRLPRDWMFARVLREQDEGAQFSEDLGRVGVRLRLDTLLNPSRLAYFLRHEAIHLLDMADPAFAYDGREALSDTSPSEEALFRDRYRLLWDLGVDGRLEARGFLPAGVRQRRFEEVAAMLPTLGPQMESVFSRLWSGERPTHPELKRMVRSAGALCSVLSIEIPSESGPAEASFPAGTPCPLCRFTTFEWAEITTFLEDAIRAEYPSWRPASGVCDQCANRYLFASSFSASFSDSSVRARGSAAGKREG